MFTALIVVTFFLLGEMCQTFWAHSIYAAVQWRNLASCDGVVTSPGCTMLLEL